MALELAQRVAQRCAQHVLEHLRDKERELEEAAIHGEAVQWSRRDRAYYVPAKWYVEELHDKQPVSALIRAWCGAEQVAQFDETEALRKEVERLRDLVAEAAHWLTSSGHPQVASRMLKAIREPEPQEGHSTTRRSGRDQG